MDESSKRAEIIDAFELLGGSFANDKDNYNLDQAHTFLVRLPRIRSIRTYVKSALDSSHEIAMGPRFLATSEDQSVHAKGLWKQGGK